MLVHLLVGDFHTQDSFPASLSTTRSGVPNPFLVFPTWLYLGPRFFLFFRFFLSLGFFSWSDEGGTELFLLLRFFSLSRESFSCSISCCCVSIWLCFSLSKRCCSRQLLLLLEDPLNHRLHRHRHTLTEGDRCCGFTQ